MRRLSDVPKTTIDELEAFFTNYNWAHGRRFEPIARRGPDAALRLVRAGHQAISPANRLT